MPRFLSYAQNLAQGEANMRLDGANINAMATTGARFGIAPRWDFYPSVLLKTLSGRSVQGDANLTFIYDDALWFGASYRHGDALVGMLQYAIVDWCSIGYSYDYTLSNLKTVNSGSHEIILRIEPRSTTNADSPRFFR